MTVESYYSQAPVHPEAAYLDEAYAQSAAEDESQKPAALNLARATLLDIYDLIELQDF